MRKDLPSKAPETIKALKGAGWNWSPKNTAWQRMITDATMRSARKIAGAPVVAPVETKAPAGTYRTMGRDFAITATFDNDDDANAYLANNPGEGVIGGEGGKVFVAALTDKGVPA